MSNCEQQMQMTNRHYDCAIAAAEQENIEVLSSVLTGSRLPEMIHNLSIAESTKAEHGLVTLLTVPAKHKPGVRTRSRVKCAGEALSVFPVPRVKSRSEKDAGIAVNNPDIPAAVPALQAGDLPLPCRGCTRNCSRYGRCGHTPWRSADTSRKRAPQHFDSTDCVTLINACNAA